MSRPGARPGRQRSATESLLSIALGLEAALVFFITMTVLGLQPIPPALALSGGATLFVILVAAAMLVRYRWGIWLGWLLQPVLLATGAVIPLMYAVGAGFVVIWIYCFFTGLRLDRRNRQSKPEEKP